MRTLVDKREESKNKPFSGILGTLPAYIPEDDSYTPSKTSLRMSAKSKSDYDGTVYENPYTGKDNKILVLGVDDSYVTMENGNRMLTGNHPIELFVVLMHLVQAGFEPVFSTLSGESIKIEEYAMPMDDEAVSLFRSKYQIQMDHPKTVINAATDVSLGDYKAVYIPGGHGAINGLPHSEDTKAALKHFIEQDKHIITICHGPASLISLIINEDPKDFPFKGYKIACFPDRGDALLTKLGYLPGKMPWGYSQRLEGLGMEIVSKIPSGKVIIDRKLISADTPMAANKLGKMAATALLND